ncbi:ABC transporter ATP-binding protein [Arthrobacter cupressi]|uniref:ABC-2 type transport system ATP-binding protein n=1 Tax=Arthrobacter cupressi TaxID=1045773 RepID=A0A1G8TGH8_9MICC|nr:ABC transporter ATP-binding protein [Arthrobacter cupressi]NYD79751.1 ABC-2 type transport system ATP-binding protein [Arthrobacter cupressi]SDJ40517.1 ABC-2 type transport system ATP-binding protein [Arthrobacter cupressi]
MNDASGPAGLAIESEGLSKRFGHRSAVDSVNLAVPRGSVYGFLGPNGSGKTTTIRLLLGLAAPTSGGIRVLGRPIPAGLSAVLPEVGALVEGPAFYPFLSGAANLRRLDAADRHAPRSTRAARIDEALELVGLSHAAGKKVRAYSLGMKQRLGIANALLRPRELLVLDEPTNGLDPQGTREVRSLVRSLAAGGTTVFVSSHLLAEVEQMCTHVGVMSVGKLVAQGTLRELRAAGTARIMLRTPDVAAAARVLSGLGLHPEPAGVLPGADHGGLLSTSPPGHTVAPEDIVAALVAAGVRVQGFSVEDASLEERFVSLTGEGFDVAG